LNAVFSHLEQTRYVLQQLFEGGFLTVRDTGRDLADCQKAAALLGLGKGSELLSELNAALTGYKAGVVPMAEATLRFANCWSYYELVLKMSVIQTISVLEEEALDEKIETPT
jgi:hypothetical protein